MKRALPDAIAALPVIDTDSHLAEPPDLWTSRMSTAKWGDAIPHLYFDERHGLERWLVGGKRLTAVANWACAGWKDYPPSFPRTIDDAMPGAFFAEDRIDWLDANGIYSQSLYPNLLCFSHHAFLRMEPEPRLECVRVYNDFLDDFAGDNPRRFIRLAALPFWDVEESVKELDRVAANGHQGIVFIAKPHKMGLPRLIDDHWAPLFERCQEMGMPVNFHVGFADTSEDDFKAMMGSGADRTDYARLSSFVLLNNSEAIADLCIGGVCHRYPELKFVSVESGFGWIPSFVETMDWQWMNSGAAKAYPDREFPSTYFKRQVYGMFWFEDECVLRIADLYPDNIMFETDFPHPTSLVPGPAS
ncbi:MAG TPA: amidohydrolase family protein, partial [Pseudonocardia sp.]